MRSLAENNAQKTGIAYKIIKLAAKITSAQLLYVCCYGCGYGQPDRRWQAFARVVMVAKLPAENGWLFDSFNPVAIDV